MFNLIDKILKFNIICYINTIPNAHSLSILGIGSNNLKQLGIIRKMFYISLYEVWYGGATKGAIKLPLLSLLFGRRMETSTWSDDLTIVVNAKDGVYKLIPGYNKLYYKNIPSMYKLVYMCRVISDNGLYIDCIKRDHFDTDDYIDVLRSGKKILNKIDEVLGELNNTGDSHGT